MVDNLLWLIPGLPLAGFVINGVWGHRLSNPLVAAIAVAGPAAAFVLSVMALLGVHEGLGPTQVVYEWIGTGGLAVPFGLQVDALTAIMLMNVTGIGTAIHLYSYGYMHEDPSFARFMAYLNLFLCAMLLLVMGDNLLLLFVGWEGVGLCSYLLIGFWYADFANVDAGRKAFIVNRIGDFSFLVGMFILYSLAGTLEWHGLELAIGQLDLAAPIASGPMAGWNTLSALTLAGLCLFGGATGKSAQIPLYVWLPDAMAGPTPVSALIHAATMVTAGVYLLGRLDFLFILLPSVSTVVAVIAACTALLSGLIALAQYDIKKVLAYSTVSQLGFMFAGMATTFWSAGLFHVVTHAFFKALLFLGAGAVIHALHHEQDVRKMGGLWKDLPMITALFAVGSLALAGVPPFAGFFSKDEILGDVLYTAEHSGSGAWWFVFVALVVTAALTAFYTTRLFMLAFVVPAAAPAQGGHDHGHAHDAHGHDAHGHDAHGHDAHGHDAHGHDAHGGARHLVPVHWTMTTVLIVLACLSAGGGFLGPHLEHFTEPIWSTGHVDEEALHHAHTLAMGLSIAIALTGIAAGIVIYGTQRDAMTRFVHGVGAPLFRIAENKFYVDELYDLVVVRPTGWIAQNAWSFIDRGIIDGTLVEGAGNAVMSAGAQARQGQSGVVGVATASTLVGAVLVLLWLVSNG